MFVSFFNVYIYLLLPSVIAYVTGLLQYHLAEAMRVCVVGAGPSGLVAGKYLGQAGIDYDIFEMTRFIGGAWVYTSSSTDKFCRPSYSNMYKNLRTNLPKDLMEFEGLSFQMRGSFLPSADVLAYLLEYSRKFNLINHIKLGHLVKNIKLLEDQWLVKYEDLENKRTYENIYDAVMVCNGHHNVPRYPVIKGQETFSGVAIHSQSYRVPETFKSFNVLVIGFGPSGQDIAIDVSSVAKNVYLSHHSNEFYRDAFPSNVISKSDVKSISGNSIHFEDNSTEEVDAIIYCTGYEYSYPFLDESCGITWENNYVRPLYRHFINIPHPTMCFLCIVSQTYLMPIMEIQAKIFVKFLLDRTTLPIKEIMLHDLETFEKLIVRTRKKNYHKMEDVAEYARSLSEVAKVKQLPPVIDKIYQHNRKHRHLNVSTYRNYCYLKLNDNNFNVTYCKEKSVL